MRAADVSAVHMPREERNRIQRYPLGGKWMGVATGLLVVTGFEPALAAFLGFRGAFLGPAVVLGSAFSGFPLSVTVT